MDVLPVSYEVRHEGEHPGVITGEVFTDGSLLYGEFVPLRRAGWSYATLDASGENLEFSAFGPLPLPAQPHPESNEQYCS